MNVCGVSSNWQNGRLPILSSRFESETPHLENIMLTKKDIETIKLRQEERKRIVEAGLSKRNPYELLDFAAKDIDKLLEFVENNMVLVAQSESESESTTL